MALVTPWRSLHKQPTLNGGELHLYRYNLDVSPAVSEDLHHLLSQDEKNRAQRLLDPEKRKLFVAARGQLRTILSRYLSVPPEAITFNYNASGKPALNPDHSSTLNFNLSHSATMAVVVIADNCSVGVDIEKIDNNLDFQPLAEQYFSSQERCQLQSVPFSRCRRTFYRLWTAKEACLKLAGTGFSAAVTNTEAVEYLKHFSVGDQFVACVTCSNTINSVKKINFWY